MDGDDLPRRFDLRLSISKV